MRRIPELAIIRLCRNCGLEVEDGEEACPVDNGRSFLERSQCTGCGQDLAVRPCKTCLSRMSASERLVARGLDWFDRVVVPAARRVGDEGRVVARETGAHTSRFTKFARLTTRGVPLVLASEREKLLLARAMVDAGLGDAAYRDSIVRLDDSLRDLEGTWNLRWPIIQERKGLLLALARVTLERGEQPDGLEAEFARALDASKAASDHRDEVTMAQSSILSPDDGLRRRALIGALILAVVVLLLFLFLRSTSAVSS